MNFENNILRLLDACAARNGRWLSTSSCAEYSRVPYDFIRDVLRFDDFQGWAERYHYEYRIKKNDRTLYLSVVFRGYA